MKKVLFIGCILLTFSCSFAQQNDKQITDVTLSKSKIESHIRFLASDELRGRNTPSPEQMIAARYLVTQLQSYGVKPLPAYPDYLQPVAMKKQAPAKDVTISYESKSFKNIENVLFLEGKNISIETEAIFLNYGTEEDFKSTDIAGKIVVVRAGNEKEMNPRLWFSLGREKRKRATEKGATALIELYNNSQLPWKILTGYFAGEKLTLDESGNSGPALSHLWQFDPDWKEAAFWKTKKKAKLQLTIAGVEEKKFNTYNVVGYLEGSDTKLKNEYVIYSAHYDHVGIGRAVNGDTIYNGARDNAIGTVTVLSAAENLGKKPTKRSALFILFTGEEKGLLGSQWFAEHSPLPLKDVVYCFNSDNAGYNNTSIATIIGLGRTTAEGFIKQACEAYGLKATDDPAPEQNLFDRSDNVSFAKKGIPAPTFSLGFTAFDEEVGKHYHQPSDQPDNLDYDYLFKFFGSYVYACRLIGNAPQRPFWKVGDKYYETGIKLYK
jgi:hypothetical protein